MKATAAAALALAIATIGPSPSSASAGAAGAATLVVKIASDQTTFRVGEEIPLALEFRGEGDPNRYFLTGNYGRTGLMTTEGYMVTPQDGTDDPLADLLSGGVGGSLRTGEHPFDGTPFQLQVSLNDWVRFTGPGRYRLTVTSTRLRLYSSPSVRPPLVAAPVDFTIVAADPAWQAGELRRAADLLDRGGDDAHRGAVILRHLDTEAAARLVVERFRDMAGIANGWDLQAALLASRHRATIVREMEWTIDTGDTLEAGYLTLLSRLQLLLEFPHDNRSDPARHSRFQALQAEYDGRWRAAVAGRPVTPAMLIAQLAQLSSASEAVRARTGEDLAAHPEQAAEALLSLPTQTQQTLLQYQWPILNRPWMVPVLRRIYEGWQGNYRFAGLGDVALRHLREASHDDGRQLILDEIRDGTHGIAYEVLASLEDTTLPALNTALASRAARGLADFPLNLAFQEQTRWLIARYGTAALLPIMMAGLSSATDCRMASPNLVYLLKHAPEQADRQLRACADVRYTVLGARYWDGRVQAAAIDALDRADWEEVVEAAQALGRYGSAAAKSPLLDRLRQWHQEWQGRATDLQAMEQSSTVPAAAIENNLVNALFDNKAFRLTEDDAAEIVARCVTDRCRVNAEIRSRLVQ